MVRTRLMALVALLAPSAAAAQSAPADHFVTLGTMGGPVPSLTRSQPANLLIRGKTAYLVDRGDGAVEQMTKAGVLLPQVPCVSRTIWIAFDHRDQ